MWTPPFSLNFRTFSVHLSQTTSGSCEDVFEDGLLQKPVFSGWYSFLKSRIMPAEGADERN